MEDLLTLEDVTSGYGKRRALSSISFSLAPGELVALAGPNGGGKTTLLKTAAGLLKPQAGRVLLAGKDISAYTPAQRAGLLAFLPQNAAASLDWPFSVREVVSQGRFPRQGWFGRETPDDTRAVLSALERAGLAGFEERAVTELSGGELQRVLLARALSQGARVLLLDEPLASLDLRYQRLVMRLLAGLAAGGLTILLSLHDLPLAARHATRVLLVSHGRLQTDAPPALALSETLINTVFGIEEDE